MLGATELLPALPPGVAAFVHHALPLATELLPLRGCSSKTIAFCLCLFQRIRLLREPFLVRLAAHREDELAAGHNLLVGDVGGVQRLAVERHRLDVAILVVDVRGLDGQCVAVLQVEDILGQVGRPEDVLAAGGTNGIEAHCAENVPRRHLSAVVVAA